MTVPATKQTETFFADCIEVWGYDGAKAIGETVIEALWMGTTQMEFPYGPPRLAFGVRAPKHGPTRGASFEEGIMVLISNAHSVGTIKLDVPDTIVHELAHKSHWQNIPTGDHDNWYTTFAGVIIEGVANVASEEILYGGFHFSSDAAAADCIETTLIELIEGKCPDREKNNDVYFQYLNGSVGNVRSRGYRAGEYVVGRFMIDNEMELGEVMRTPLAAFREFVEQEL